MDVMQGHPYPYIYEAFPLAPYCPPPRRRPPDRWSNNYFSSAEHRWSMMLSLREAIIVEIWGRILLL